MMSTHRKAFLLVELIVAVSILSIGIVLVLRSLLTAAAAAGYISDRIEAVNTLEGKVCALEELAQNGELVKTDKSEDIFINNRKASCAVRAEPLTAALADKNELMDILLRVSWQESSRQHEEALATKLVNMKK